MKLAADKETNAHLYDIYDLMQDRLRAFPRTEFGKKACWFVFTP